MYTTLKNDLFFMDFLGGNPQYTGSIESKIMFSDI